VEDIALYFVPHYRHSFGTTEKKRREGKKASCLFVPNCESNRPAADRGRLTSSGVASQV